MVRRIQYRPVFVAVCAAVCLVLGCAPAGSPGEGRVTRVDVEEFARRIQQGDPIVLDVRTPDEFASGHIPGAINLDIHSPSFTEELRRLDRDQSYLVYCRSGRRSARACGLMAAEGFHRLHDLSPGFNGWKSAGEAVGR